MRIATIIYLSVTVFTFLLNQTVQGQQSRISGIVIDSTSGDTLPGVHVRVQNSSIGSTTNREGQFTLEKLSPGTYHIVFSYMGFQPLVKKVTLDEGEARRMSVRLVPKTIKMGGIQVTALQPGRNREATIQTEEVRKANPRDSGELLRELSGISAVRRGPVGLDPVVRGLRETEVGVYLDGTRIFPGGPARMDSPLSHLDPSAIQNIEVIKGPYALTSGAGNMSAIRVETRPLASINKQFGGQVSSGYDHNFNALEESASLQGRFGDVGYWVHGAWRKGNDYESGNGTTVPAEFLSWEIRGKIGYDLTNASNLTVSAGYQDQRNIDYPGRLLNAYYFETTNLSARWSHEPNLAKLKSLDVLVYLNEVEHGMDNDDKPTARPDPDRMPPFAIDVKVDADVRVGGGRVESAWDAYPGGLLTAGTDLYVADKRVVRTIRRRDNQNVMFEDLMWPKSSTFDWGVFAKIDHTFSDRLTGTTSLRFDYVFSDADTASAFFLQQTDVDLGSTERNLSGSATLNYKLTSDWELGIGAGSVVRTADATERYSDRIPSSKAQMSAEFVGNPALQPERSTQADLWIDYHRDRWYISGNIFARHINNYITLTSTDLDKRLPLSPSTVYKYINGDAQFWGFEITGRFRPFSPFQIEGSLSYLWGEDTELDEPVLGVSPLGVDVGARYDFSNFPLFLESTLHVESEQDRVSISRGEGPTGGYATIDVLGGFQPWKWLSIHAGIQNLTDMQYMNHLNAKNPFTGQSIPEPGRVIHADLHINF